ncbi:hypothetical protein P3L51_12985 [Streptomyces sp. PSRA5]
MSEISHTREFDAFPGFPDLDPDPDVPIGPSTPSATGRAARRRRLADWKKQRRRAVVASTVALVGGGLTLAFMPSSRPSASQAQASSTPDPVTAPSTSSAGSVDTGSETELPRTRAPQLSESGTGPSKADHSPGSATAITPVDAPAKQKTPPPPATPDDVPPTAETQPQAPTAPAVPDTPPAAEDPTPQPNKPTAPAPAPPPPSAEPPEESDPGLCVLVLCLDLDGN